MAFTVPNSADATNPAKMCWDTGGPGSVVLVTAYYPWTLFAPVLNSALLTTGNSTQRVIVATAAFKNEPYDDTVSAPKPKLESARSSSSGERCA